MGGTVDKHTVDRRGTVRLTVFAAAAAKPPRPVSIRHTGITVLGLLNNAGYADNVRELKVRHRRYQQGDSNMNIAAYCKQNALKTGLLLTALICGVSCATDRTLQKRCNLMEEKGHFSYAERDAERVSFKYESTNTQSHLYVDCRGDIIDIGFVQINEDGRTVSVTHIDSTNLVTGSVIFKQDGTVVAEDHYKLNLTGKEPPDKRKQ